MNILINCSNLKIGGGIQVAHSFLNEVALNQDDNFVIVLSSELSKHINENEFSNNHFFYYYDTRVVSTNILFGKNNYLDKIVRKHNIEKVFSVFGPTYWRPKVFHISGFAKAQYIYYDSPYYAEIKLKEKLKLRIKKFFHLNDFKKNCDVLITENPDVSQKIKKLLRKNVYTVTNNYHQIFDNNERWKKIVLPKFYGKYILTIAANYPHKNLKIIPHVVKELLDRNIRDFKFITTLRKGELETNPEIDKFIIYLGKVNISECPNLYEQSSYMLLPTLLESFSASYAEAMRMKCIILTSNLPFAKGICGNAALYFDPLNPKDIVDTLLRIDCSTEEQNILKDRGFKRLNNFDSPKQRAKKYLEIIKKT